MTMTILIFIAALAIPVGMLIIGDLMSPGSTGIIQGIQTQAQHPEWWASEAVGSLLAIIAIVCLIGSLLIVVPWLARGGRTVRELKDEGKMR